jgi:hypothetical protein
MNVSIICRKANDICCHLALFWALIREARHEEVMLQRLVVAFILLDERRAVYRILVKARNLFPCDGEILSLSDESDCPEQKLFHDYK